MSRRSKLRAVAVPKPSPYAPAVHPATQVTPPVQRQASSYAWSLETIRAARDAQLRGDFARPVRLAESMRTDDALFTAYQARVAIQSAIKLLWRAQDSDEGRSASTRAERAIIVPPHIRESITGTLANHGVAIGYVLQDVVDDPEHGPTVRFTLTEWPLEHVRYNPSTCTLETRTQDNGTITITHGDGRWIYFRKFGHAPWTQDACLLPGALLWAAHAHGISDWASASFSHGQPKVIGTPPEGMTIQSNDGSLLPEPAAFLATMQALTGGESSAGITPAGYDTKLLYNGSTAWQVFDALVLNREKAAMRIYVGTDAALGSQGGAPGVDIAALFGVASQRIQGDLEALERGYREGMIEPWAHLHNIADALLPLLAYAMPDPDADRRSAQEAAAVDRLAIMVKAMKDTGLEVTQDTVDALVRVLGVTVPCALAAVETRAIPLQLAPTDVAKVVTVNEARAAQGLPPRDGGDITIAEQDALLARQSAPPVPGAEPGTEPVEDPAQEYDTEEPPA